MLLGDRQFKREKSKNVKIVNFDEKKIYKLIKQQEGKRFKCSKIYGDGKASIRIVKTIESVKEIEIQKTLNY